MNREVTFIGGPLDLQRIVIDERNAGQFYRHAKLPQTGFTNIRPVFPQRAHTVEYVEYEIFAFNHPRGRPTYVGVLMELS